MQIKTTLRFLTSIHAEWLILKKIKANGYGEWEPSCTICGRAIGAATVETNMTDTQKMRSRCPIWPNR